jgi:DnaK suppressor protein
MMKVMEQKKLKGLRERLVAKQREIVEAYNKNKSYGQQADEDGAQDIADKATSSYAKEFLFSLSNSERDTLQLVEEALLRLEGDHFGTCQVCSDPVERKRLEAVPWAKYCLGCQEKKELGLL